MHANIQIPSPLAQIIKELKITILSAVGEMSNHTLLVGNKQ